jgi:ABC-type branched-subunit amino acid transport system substrate-binding protein/heat shock protein HspQ
VTGASAAEQPIARPRRTPGGAAELLALVARLLRRPRRSEHRLPLIWVIGATGQDVLRPLLRRLTGAPRRRVPHVTVDAARYPDGSDVRPLLDEAHNQLSLDAFGAEPFHFRHYSLARWLMDQTLPGVEVHHRRARLAEQLRDRRRRLADPDRGGAGAETAFAVFYRFLIWLVRRAVPGVVFRAAVSGRVPLVGRHYRWFMRQQYLAPRQSVTFVGFAERLTTGWRNGEQPDQVNKLLVHAFLEDLRRAYSRWPARLAGWRRTAYPILLVDNVQVGNAGHTLLRLMNEVRNETGRADPLLVVGAADEPPAGTGGSSYRLVDAEAALDDWWESLPERRRLRRSDAWYLLLTADDEPSGRVAPRITSDLVVPPPPWWARRITVAGLVLALLAGSLVWAGGRWGPGCLPQPLRGNIAVRLVDGECIGYSDNAGYVFNRDAGQDALRAVQERIFRQNQEVDRVWAGSDRRRPLMTLVYLGIMTGQRTGPNEVSYVSEREELEGMAVAQYARMKASASTDGQALLRIVIANGGQQMRHAEATVELLAELAERDPTVVGVVGLVESRTTTARALRRLNEIGLPAIAPTLSADGLYRNSRLYLQMVAPNADQAALVAGYAADVLGVADAHVHYTTGDETRLEDDLYVRTLVEGVTQRFGERATVSQFRFGDSLAHECGYQGLLFFAGRYSEFDEFLEALRGCGNNPPAHLVADDSVNRYMANHQLRANAPGNLPVAYVSKAALGTCNRLRADAATDEVRRSFLDLIGRDDLLTPPRCTSGDSPAVGERVALAYDASMMLIQAVEQLAGRLAIAGRPWEPAGVSPVAVFTEVLRQNATAPYAGVTGPTTFSVDTGEPVQKRLSLMYVASVPDVSVQPREIYFCGRARPDDPPGCRRP